MTRPLPEPVADRAELIEFFGDDPRVHIYALADLCEPFWTPSTWWRRGDAVVGVVPLSHGSTAVYAVSSRDPDATLELLADALPEIPPGSLITGPLGSAEVARPTREIVWERTYHRYHLTDRGRVPDPGEIEPLGRTHTDELLELYATDPGAAFFLPSMLDDDAYVGIRDRGRLVAVAGTHVVAEEVGVAAIGAVVTHPDHRRRGLGRRSTAGVIARLGDRVPLIGLNCADRNTGARAMYEAMGFERLLGYEECELGDRTAPAS